MTVFNFDLKGTQEEKAMMKDNLKRVGAGDDLPYESRVHALQKTVAELLTALQKAGVKTHF